jgi:plasmid stabilization system protein ParE
MRRIVLLPPSKRTLREIYAYTIKLHGRAQAKKYLAGLHQHFIKIADMPKLYGRSIRPGSPLLKAQYGDTKRPHTIYFRETPDGGIEIGRIAHPGQDFTRDLAEYERAAKRLRQLERQQSRDHEPGES